MDGRSKQVTRRGYHNYCMELVVEEKDVEFDWGVVCINSLVRRLSSASGALPTQASWQEKFLRGWLSCLLGAQFIGNVSRFLNHSCDPNVRVAPIWRGPELPMIGIFADKDIAAGGFGLWKWRGRRLPLGETRRGQTSSGCLGFLFSLRAGDALTYAYGAGYEEMLCLCGAPNCKGFLGIET